MGAFLLLGQSTSPNPSEAVLMVGFALLVVPVASLAQKWLRGKIEEANDDDDKWSHLPR